MIRHRQKLAGCALVVLAGCAASSLGHNLGTEVLATGSSITLSWDPLHAWNAQLATGGAQLVAEYAVEERGLVREVLSKARPVRERIIAFALPEALKNAPKGEVCLYVQLPATNALLPVRMASGGQDTARFRYAAWEARASMQSQARYLALDAETLGRQLTDAREFREKRMASLARRGVGSAQECDAVDTQRGISEKPPISVVPAAQQDSVARQVCIGRIEYSRRLFLGRLAAENVENREALIRKFSVLAMAAPQAADALLKQQPGMDGMASLGLQERQKQARVLAEDWRKYSPTVGKDFWPPFGKADDYLEIIGESRRGNEYLLRQLYGEPHGLPPVAAAPSPRDLFGALGALMDAYSGCVDDGRRQLKAIADNWTALQAASPERERRVRSYQVAECRREHQQLDTLRSTESKLADDLARVQERLTQAKSATPAMPTSQRQSLNGERCGG